MSRTEDPQRLASQFLWFDGELEDELGEDRFDELLKYNSDSDGVKEYVRIMSLPREYGRIDRVKNATSEIVMSWIRKEPKIERSEMRARGLMTMSSAEALKLAEQFIIETDTDIKASIASVFTFGKYRWPLDAGILIECGTSDNKRLAKEVNTALSLLKDERLHDYAISILEKGFDSTAVSILINNIRKSDESFILSLLQELPVTEENDPNGNLNKPGGYTSTVYFGTALLGTQNLSGNPLIDEGTDAGGAVETYRTAEEAETRNNYLASFDGAGMFSSGSHMVLGTMVIRTSDDLKASQQETLTNAIIAAMTSLN